MSTVRSATNRNAAALVAALLGAAAAVLPVEVLAFGGLGHRVAGVLAERELCPDARSEVAALGDGQSLAELGLWADTIRGDPAWERSVPWHYINVPDLARDAGETQARAAIKQFHHPPEGDVLTAIARFSAVLADRARPREERAEALRFVVHFVVDVHQPLHVSRESDGGGTDVEVRVGEDVVSLHRFWDTNALNRRHVSAEQFAQQLEASFAAVPAVRAHDPPAVWAAESLALRPTVYSFAPGPGPVLLDDAYRRMAQSVAEQRLVLAAARLAVTLNGALCGTRPH